MIIFVILNSVLFRKAKADFFSMHLLICRVYLYVAFYACTALWSTGVVLFISILKSDLTGFTVT